MRLFILASYNHVLSAIKLEDLKVLKCSPESDIESQDLLDSVKLGHGRLRLIILTLFCMTHIPNPKVVGLLVPENTLLRVYDKWA